MPRPRMCPDFYANSAIITEDEAVVASNCDKSGDPVDLSRTQTTSKSPVPVQGGRRRHRQPSSPYYSWRTATSSGRPSPEDSCDSLTNPPSRSCWPRRDSQPDSVPPVGFPDSSTMPTVVDNQREKYDTDAVFRRLSRETEVRYAGVPTERPIDHRRRQFEADLDRGFLLMSIVSSGIHILLTFRNPRNVPEASSNFERDLPAAEIRNGQLFLRCRLILNGVSVIWNGHVDMETLDGLGRLEFDAAAAESREEMLLGTEKDVHFKLARTT